MFTFENKPEWARTRDQQDELASFRNEFFIPPHQGQDTVYLCGNSLGLQPRNTAVYVNEELNDWAKLGVEGHFKKHTGWFAYHELLRESMARLV